MRYSHAENERWGQLATQSTHAQGALKLVHRQEVLVHGLELFGAAAARANIYRAGILACGYFFCGRAELGSPGTQRTKHPGRALML